MWRTEWRNYPVLNYANKIRFFCCLPFLFKKKVIYVWWVKYLRRYIYKRAGFRIRIRMFLPCPDPDPHKFTDPDPGKKVREWMNKPLFCRVGDVQCKQFHFFCSDFKHPLLRIIWNVIKTQKKIHFSLYPQPPPPDTPRIRIRIRMKIFARIRIRIRKKKMRIRNPDILPFSGFKSRLFKFESTPNGFTMYR